MTVPALNTYAALDRPLTIAEVDENWAQIVAAFTNVLGVAHVNDLGDGRSEFVAADGTILGTIAQAAPFAVAGEWAAEAAYTTHSVVTWEGGAYLGAVAHTASESFPADFASGKWLLLSQSGEDGQDGQPGEDGADGSTVYNVVFDEETRVLTVVTDSDEFHATIPAGSAEGDGPVAAGEVFYDGDESGLAAGDVQTALDELAERDADISIDGGELTLTTPQGRTVTLTLPSGGGGTPSGGDTVESLAVEGSDLILTTDQQVFTVALPPGGASGPVASEDVSFETFDSSDHAITATNVRDALEELADREALGRKAENIATNYVDVTVEDALDDYNFRLTVLGDTLQTLDQRVTDNAATIDLRVNSEVEILIARIEALEQRVATLESPPSP